MSVWIEKLGALPAGRDNGCAGAQGQPAGPAFPKAFKGAFEGHLRSVLLGLSAQTNLDRRKAKPQLFSNDLILLSNSSNGASPTIVSPLMKKVGVPSTFST